MRNYRLLIAATVIGVLAGMLFSYGFFMYWVTQYPEDYDPKNIDYVLWTHDLNKNMNLDDALSGMTHDAWSVRLVKGLTTEELKHRFGRIRTLPEARPYDQLCTAGLGQLGTSASGKQVFFLRDSDWMVVMENGKAVDLILGKGY